MNSLLILGSKPDPVLPPPSSYTDIACANASGYSAARQDLPSPVYTVMSAILTYRESGRQSLDAIAGLQTDTVFFLPRGEKQRNPLNATMHYLKTFKMKPLYFKWILQSLGYKYQRFVSPSYEYYYRLVVDLCDHDEHILQQLQQKRPSTGILALAIGIMQKKYDRFIMSGFSFELTHAYAVNPEIEEKGSVLSKHTDTDVAIINYLARKYGNIYTTELIVNQRTGVPLLGGEAE